MTQRGAAPDVAIPVGTAIAAAFAAGAVVFALKSGTRLVLAASGARPADAQQYSRLHNVVEEMAISAGLPKPGVYVIDDASPNAFVDGGRDASARRPTARTSDSVTVDGGAS